MSDLNVIKIVVDTNLWISFCVGSQLSVLVDAIIKRKVTLCFSKELHDEIFEVLSRPKLKKIIKQERVKALHSLLQNRINFTSKLSSSPIIERDPKDNFLLDLAVSSKADCIITGDKDLLVLNPFREIKIVTVKDFEDLIK